MTSIELFTVSITLAFLIGVLVTVAVYEPTNRMLYKAMVDYRIQAINAKSETESVRHQGTPYIRRTTGPGLRVVGGQTMYSSDWLNDR